MPVPLPPGHDPEAIAIILFCRRRFTKRQVAQRVKDWGYNPKNILEGPAFWRLVLKEVPPRAKDVNLMRLEEGIYALEVHV
ncbi:MAG: hypothetical protein ABDI20_01260 [Candidatus Bipolaricaulaceae bacterium]